jgi:hypothetical protein
MLQEEHSMYLCAYYFSDKTENSSREQPDPKETYQQALEKAGTPTDIIISGNPLNKTSMISDDDYISNYNAVTIFEDMEATHERFG